MTTNGTLPNSNLEIKPQAIGAQELLQNGLCSKSDFMRKQGRLERILKFLKWRQRFVVLSGGCIYVYANEIASKPLCSYSLKLFLKCERATDLGMYWPFRVIPINAVATQTLMFACISDNTRKDWMKCILEEMMKAHNLSEGEISKLKLETGIDEYVQLESYVIQQQQQQQPNLLPLEPVSEDDEGLNNDENYSEILEDLPELKGPHKNPPLNKPYGATLSLSSATECVSPKGGHNKKAVTLPCTEYNPATLPIASFEYTGSDRDQIATLLTSRPEGTFLIRQSRNDKKKVLSVNIDGTLKEFKIYENKGRKTLDSNNCFASHSELIAYYTTNTLPKKDAKLYRPYAITESGYKNY